MNNGNNIDECIEDPDKVIEAGWWSVVHHSTENLIIGKFIKPKIDIAEVILFTLSLFWKTLQLKMYRI